jgi:hypothetical protein
MLLFLFSIRPTFSKVHMLFRAGKYFKKKKITLWQNIKNPFFMFALSMPGNNNAF